MSKRKAQSRSALSRGFINLQDQYLNSIMDVRKGKDRVNLVAQREGVGRFVEGRKLEYCKSFSQGHGGRMLRYFPGESLFVFVCLTTSLLILPLILPPLPPPPSLFLLLPIVILVLLMFLAFMPFNAREAAYGYA